MSRGEGRAWLRALEIPLGAAPAALLLPVADPAHRPRLDLPDELPVVPVAVAEGSLEDGDALETYPGPVVMAPPAVPARSRDVTHRTSEGVDLYGEAAVLARLLTGPLEGRRAALFVTNSLLVSREAASFRAWLSGARAVEWVLFLGPPGAEALGVSGLKMGVVVVGAQPSAPGAQGNDGEVHLVRLANLTGEPAEWAPILEAAAGRQGGEVHDSIVLRDRELAGESWTYRRYSREFRESREDAATLGAASVSLRELAEVRSGLGPKDLTAFVRESRSESLEPALATFGRRSLADGELGRPTHMLAELLVPQQNRLLAGDLLVGVHPEADKPGLTVVRVNDDALPATFESDLLAVRFHDDVPEQLRELVEGYLASPHALEWLRAEGALPRVRPDQLARLPVPQPKDEVLEALEGLAEAERVYRQWAREARQARGELFARSSFADSVPALLTRQRLERERVQAGEDSRTLDYRVRNDYPHPVAVRRESLLQKAHGVERVKEVQECAEIAVTIASFLALVQWRALEEEAGAGMPPHLAKYVVGGKFNFDWGKHRSFLDSVIAATRGHDNPLALPIPELATLDLEDPWSRAEAELRDARNKAAHLYRPSPSEARVLSERMDSALYDLLEGLALLSTARLAVVSDYARDPVSGARTAEIQLLRGASRVFPRHEIQVDEELSRHSVGLFDASQHFHLLTPWLVWKHCGRCEQHELFAFARFDGEDAQYLALASGHPWESEGTTECLKWVLTDD